MKKLFKLTSLLTAALILFAACSTTPAGTTVGNVNGKEIKINYYDEIFTEETSDENESSTNNSTTNQSTDNESSSNENDEPEYDESSAMLMNVFGTIFEETGNTIKDKKKINAAVNNLKGQYGDKYLAEASEKYKLPIKNDKDLLAVLTFSLSYSEYIEKMADITDAKISEEYYKNYQTKYCASHVLVEKEEDAKKLLSKITSGEKTFADYTAEAQAIFDEKNANSTSSSTSSKLNVNDVEISGVKVKQFADLDCASSNSYVGEFGRALEGMEAGTVSATPVKTEYGYHLIDLREIKTTELTKEVQEEIKSSLLQAKQKETGFSSYYLQKLVQEVTVEITDEKVKKLYDEYLKSLEEAAKEYTPEDERSSTNNETSSANNEASSKNN